MSMKTYYEIKDMLCEELEHQAKKGKINSPSDLDVLDKLTHALKSIGTVIAMEEAEEDGYSERGNSYRYSMRDGRMDRGASYARGRTNARRDSMGRYSRADGYSMDDGKADMIEQMRMMMNSAPDERTRARYQDMIRDMETM